MESRPTQAVLPLVGLAADRVIRVRYILADRLTGHNKTTQVPSFPGTFGSGGPRFVTGCKSLVPR
ncbi:MAG: hypothetical protein ACQESR_30295 [Planctomycetota bacterium]